jgi:hypothetical protein
MHSSNYSEAENRLYCRELEDLLRRKSPGPTRLALALTLSTAHAVFRWPGCRAGFNREMNDTLTSPTCVRITLDVSPIDIFPARLHEVPWKL